MDKYFCDDPTNRPAHLWLYQSRVPQLNYNVMLSLRKLLYLIWFELFLFLNWGVSSCCFNLTSQSEMSLLLPIFYLSPAFWKNPHMDFDKVYISNRNYLVRTTSHKLKITYYNITITYETWLEWHYVAISMISGGSRSFAVGEGKLLFQSRKFQNGYGLYCLWRNKWGFSPSSPLGSSALVTDGVPNVDSTVCYWWGFFDEFYKLMLVSQYFITQRKRKSDLWFQNW